MNPWTRAVVYASVVLSAALILRVWAADPPHKTDTPTTQPAVDQSETTTHADSPPCCPINDQPQPAAPDTPAPTPPPASDPSPATPTPARASQWIEPDQRQPFDLDFAVTDQDGQSMSLSDLAGTPVAMSFIFTRCPQPKMCPLITTTMANLQQTLQDQGLAQQVKLVLLTYDPVYDTPQRLKQYGLDRGLDLASGNALMLRPSVDTFRQLLLEFQIGVDYDPDGSIGHFIELLLIDHQGRFVRDYQGQVWDNTAVRADLQRLIAEQDLVTP